MQAYMLFLAVALGAIEANATERPGQPPEGGLPDIAVQEWTELTAGKTVTYRIDGQFWALERYVAGTNRVMIQFSDSSCLEGTWEYVEPLYCFHWIGEGTSCFRHVRMGEEILVLETERGVETGDVQVMTGVSDTPLACGPAIS